ncbi:relaxase/mobilization nuclease domain-containing protein [Sphingobacterium siyangense]|uniref:relaxase/mobilization nuclease domain-containing protein n=1 Tax=Sphingobacterium siyangense TaxID=459529 RepID=UPI003DA6AC31
MVIRGNSRGNGSQLARYLTTQGDNEAIHLLEVDGNTHATAKQLHDTLLSMSLMAELTKSAKGLYHAQINPAYGEDKAMTDTNWQQAVDILAKELGFGGQRRAIVLHEKKGRTHAHVVWERYDYQTGKIIDTPFNYLAHDRARQAMERVFTQQQTPVKNNRQPELKEQLTEYWNNTVTATEFIKAVEQAGYLLAAGIAKRPFMVVDDHGRSFDLVRQLKGINTKAVRERLGNIGLMPEKKAIAQIRERQQAHAKDKATSSPQKPKNRDLSVLAHEFTNNKKSMLAGEKKKETIKEYTETRETIIQKQEQTPTGTVADKKMAATKDFAENKTQTLSREDRKQALINDMRQQLRDYQRPQSRDQGISIGE